MSHYTRVKTKMKKRSSIIAALKEMGFKEHMIEVSDSLLDLKGYRGDTRQQKAHIRIKGSGWSGQNYVGGMSNDLGFEQQADGTWTFHVSEYDRGKYGKGWQEGFKNQYARSTVKEHCKKRNFFVTEDRVEGDGTIVMKLRTQF